MDGHLRAQIAERYTALLDAGRVIIRDRFVPTEELQDAIAAMDVVCTPYPRHPGIASVLLQAAAAERPVVASSFGWLGYVTQRFALGVACDVEDIDGLASHIVTQLDDAPTYALSPEGQRFVDFHTSARFQQEMLRLLRGGDERDDPSSGLDLFSDALEDPRNVGVHQPTRGTPVHAQLI
jgi:glycosyltransferase involved in cell wall biosynthesis